MLQRHANAPTGCLKEICSNPCWQHTVKCRLHTGCSIPQTTRLAASIRSSCRPALQLSARRRTTEEAPTEETQTASPPKPRRRKTTKSKDAADILADAIRPQDISPAAANVAQHVETSSQNGVSEHIQQQHATNTAAVPTNGQAAAENLEAATTGGDQSRVQDAVSVPPPEAVASTPDPEQQRMPVAGQRPLPALNRQGYQSFELEGVELLVAETAAGQLDLADCFVLEAETEVYSRPMITGEMPAGPCTFQTIPWYDEYYGDVLQHREPWRKVLKMIFIPVIRQEPYLLDLNQVFIFEVASRQMYRADVEHRGPPLQDPVLRIRPDKVTIEDSSYIPEIHEVVDAYNAGREAMPQISEDMLRELEAELEEPPFKEIPDVPPVDLL